jgi:hypothetical protein
LLPHACLLPISTGAEELVYQLFKFLSTQQLAIRQLPVFVISFAVAALFYKFGSFMIECIAFLATWMVLDYLAGFFFKDGAKDTVATKEQQRQSRGR